MKDEFKAFAKISLLAFVLAFSACQKNTVENVDGSPSSFIVPVAVDPAPSATPDLSAPIRKVDFKNFRYPSVYMDEAGLSFSGLEKRSDIDFFELKNGRQAKTETEDGATLGKIEFADVTGDGESEAIVEISPETGGNCSCNMVYIYGYYDRKLRLLWAFGSSDRAQGGLKKIYAENGGLVVELFGDSRFENGKWNYTIPEGKFNGLCCPTVFTRTRFKWNGEKFAVEGTPELFDYDWKKRQSSKDLMIQ